MDVKYVIINGIFLFPNSEAKHGSRSRMLLFHDIWLTLRRPIICDIVIGTTIEGAVRVRRPSSDG